MSGSVNKCIIVGNLGRDPEVHHTQSGDKVVNMSIATSESWKDKATGERREKTEWIRVVIWNERLADVAEKYLAKGRSVYIEGQLRTRKWVDQSGQERYSTEVVLERYRGELTLLGGRGDDAGGDTRSGESRENENRAARQGAAQDAKQGSLEELDDEIPF